MSGGAQTFDASPDGGVPRTARDHRPGRGLIVSNHGGRHFEAAPPAVDALPAVVARVGGRMTIMMDGSIRSGLDVVRALSRGAVATFAGRAFLFGHGAFGKAGAAHVARSLAEEIHIAMVQAGAIRPSGCAESS